MNKNNGVFNPIKLALNKGITVPITGQHLPFKDYETGVLRFGNGDPKSKDYDSLADYYINKNEDFLEIRIPWALLGFTDPSTLQIMGDFYENGLESRKNIDGFSVAIAVYEPNDLKGFDSLPRLDEGKIFKKDMYNYTWSEWNEPKVKERFKESYYILKDVFSKY